jgi:hypothetical protein
MPGKRRISPHINTEAQNSSEKDRVESAKRKHRQGYNADTSSGRRDKHNHY